MNSFVGLRPFETSESHLFFGRESHINDILKKLYVEKFCAIIGYSGSGKTSLIKSGIIPTLNKTENWNIALFRPGNNPLENLVISLFESFSKKDSTKKIDDFTDLLRNKEIQLPEILGNLEIDVSIKTLLVVDQFEEIFGLDKEKQSELVTFIDLLISTINAKSNNIYVLLTLRSDYIGNCTIFSGLPEILNKSQYLIPRLTKAQFHKVITAPLKLAELKIADKLVNTLVADLKDNADQLPVLQHTMMRTVAYCKKNGLKNGTIDLQHYIHVGKMEMALSNHADEIFNKLTNEEKNACELLFKALASFDNVGLKRNPNSFYNLCKITNVDSNILLNIIDAFRAEDCSFLTPKPAIIVRENTIIDISHESLLRLWAKLKLWLKEEEESVANYKKLCDGAAMHQEGKGSLLVNPELQIALKWYDTQKPSEAWSLQYETTYFRVVNYLETSKKTYEQDIVFKNIAQVKRLKRNKQVATFMSLAFVVCLFLMIFSWIEKQKATKATKEAISSSITAEKSKIEALNAKDTAEISKNIAIENEKIAKQARDSAAIARDIAMQKTIEANTNKQEAIVAKDAALISVINEQRATKNAKVALQKAKEQKAEADRLKNLSTAIKMAFESEKSFDLKLINQGIKQAKDAYILFKNNNNSLEKNNQIFNALNRALLEGKDFKSKFYRHAIGLSKVIKSKQNELIVVLDEQNSVFFLKDTKKGLEKINNKIFLNIKDICFNANNDLLILTTNKGIVKFVNIYSFKEKYPDYEAISETNNIQSFTKNTVEYIVVSNTTTIKIIDIKNKQNVDASELNAIKPNFIKFSTNSKRLAIFKNNRIFIYNINLQNKKLILSNKKVINSSKNIASFKFLESGIFATISKYGIIKIYDINNAENPKLITEIQNHKNVTISNLEILNNNNKDFIISSSFDNTINITNLKDGKDFISLKGHNSWVKDIYLDTKNKKIYSVSQDASLRFWYTDIDDIFKLLKN